MMPKHSLNPKDIIRLLSKLKEETPEYPTNLLEARKAAILKQAVTLKIQGKGPGGEGGGQGGSSGTGGPGPAAGGGTAAQGFLLQALVGFSVIAAMLLTGFAFRDKISKILRNNDAVTVNGFVGESLTPASISTTTAVATVTPVFSPSPTTVLPTGTATPLATIIGNSTPFIALNTPLAVGTPDSTKKPNPGLHLGQTPGTPAAPGQGNPGNVNQPDKPDKPDRPDKPPKPPKPPKK